MWRSCWLYSKSYWSFPIQLHSAEKRALHNNGGLGIRIWKIGITFMIGYFNIILQTFAVFAHISVGNPAKAFLSGFIVSFSVFNIIFGHLILKYAELVTTAINCLFVLEEQVKSIQNKNKAVLVADFVGLVLLAMTAVFGCIPYLATLSGPVHDIPFLTVEGNDFIRSVGVVVRKCVFFITVFEFCRTMCGLLLVIILCVKIIQGISVNLMSSVQKQYFRFGQYMNVYNGLIIINQHCRVFLCPAVALLIASGISVCVACNLITVKFRTDAIPFPFFYIFPGLAIFTPFMLNIVLPEGILCHELTKDLLFKWRSSVYSVWSKNSNRKYVVRRLRALRTFEFPVGIAGFNFFYIVRDTKIAIYTNIMDSTINAILSVPDMK
jgi:hypothetical protein